MLILTFLLQLFAASLLLMIAVRMVRKGIEVAFVAELRSLFRSDRPRLQAMLCGVALAIMLQGATGVILLSSGLVASGMMTLASALAVAIGADIGSAIVVRILTFDISWLISILLVLGGWSYLNLSETKLRNIGRAAVGIALILIALTLISDAVSPLKQATFLPQISAYLEQDLITAFLVGLALTFLLHSSVASILVSVTLVASDAFSVYVGVAYIFGANMGSALIPVWLTRARGTPETRLPLLNLVIRGIGSILALMLFLLFEPGDGDSVALSAGDQVIAAHLMFNLALAPLVFIAGPIAGWMEMFWDKNKRTTSLGQGRVISSASALEGDLGAPVLSVRRDVLAMLDLVSAMLSKSAVILEKFDATVVADIKSDRASVGEHMASIRALHIKLGQGGVSQEETKRLRDQMEYALKLRQAAEKIMDCLVVAAQERDKSNVSFSDVGWSEISNLQAIVQSNTLVAFDVAAANQLSRAEQLVALKTKMSRAALKSRRKHFKRLAAHNTFSISTSDLHLSLTAGLKEINSKIATYAYALLDTHGRLANNRLIDDAED